MAVRESKIRVQNTSVIAAIIFKAQVLLMVTENEHCYCTEGNLWSAYKMAFAASALVVLSFLQQTSHSQDEVF